MGTAGNLVRLRAGMGLLAGMGMLAGMGAVQAQVSVTTFHNDNARTGQNTQETTLTPANVNSSQFGKLFSVALDGYVYAQPLYLADVTIGGSAHNVVYMATEHDSVYAIDADSGTIYAQVSLIPAGGSTVSASSDLGCPDLTPEIGITGTPVIDTSTNTLYVVSKAKTAAGTVVQYLHALNVTTLAEEFGGPKLIAPSAAGSAPDGTGSIVPFNARIEFQRPALLLDNGHVVVGFSGHCDANPWHGWVVSYSASTLAQEAAFNVTPNGSGGGVWMSGGGLAADASGNIYFPTGNGTWNGSTDFGDSIVKLGAPSGGKFPVLDYFTPWNQSALDSGDIDVSSGGLLLVPPLPSGEQLLAQQGKFGSLVVLNGGNLGKYCPKLSPACSGSDTNTVQELTNQGRVYGSPAYWNGNFYIVSEGLAIRAYSVNAGGSGKLSSSPTSQTSQVFAYAAPTPAISANGTSNGILWAIDGSAYNSTCGSPGVNCLGLFAYDATNLSKLLYNSSQSANGSPGVTVKFAVPVIANGKVYVGTQSGLAVYGLLAHAATLAAPSFGMAAGSYASSVSVSLSDATAAASIYYTMNGAAPTTASAKYSAPLSIATTTTIKAIAAASGYTNSLASTATYTITASGSSSGGGSSGAGSSGVSVGLSASDSVYGIASNGVAVPGGGLDGGGSSYSATLLGSSLTWSGTTFKLGPAGVPNTASSRTIALPAGLYSSLNLLGSAVNGDQPNQTFTVTYSDGTTASYTRSISDWAAPAGYSGESTVATMAYRVTASGATQPGPFYLYGYALALNSAKSAVSITLPANKHVMVLAISLTAVNATPPVTPPAGTPVSVSLTSAGNVYGMASNGSNVPDGGLDGGGAAYSSTLLGSSLAWSGATFKFGAAGTANAVSGRTIALPAGQYTSLALLGTGVDGEQPNQAFIITYSDGSKTTVTQSLSDWWAPSGYAGESKAATMAYRVSDSPTATPGPYYLYGYTLPLNGAKSVVSLTLPANSHVIIVAAELMSQ